MDSDLPLRLAGWAGCTLAFGAVYALAARVTSPLHPSDVARLPFEARLPAVADALVVYASMLPVSFAAFWTRQPWPRVTRLMRAGAIGLVVAAATFVSWPHQLPRPRLVLGTFAMREALAELWRLDTAANTLPSLHVFIAALCALHLGRASRGGRWVWGLWFLAVWASTVLTGQHALVDGAAGLALAAGCYALAGFGWRSSSRPILPAHISPTILKSEMKDQSG